MTAEAPITTAPRRRLADELRAAIARGEVELRFQPQVEMASGRISGVEVLARWQHPELGELGAERLFAAAARAALLQSLSRHIQVVALTDVAAWPAALAGLTVALNVTAADLARPGFARELLVATERRGIAPARLTLEITEHEPIADLPAAAAVLGELRGAGFKVALDDYGCGYSGEAWLRALPLDYLKLDRSEAGAIFGSAAERARLTAVIASGLDKGLGVVAEGVESEAHRALLAAAGVTHYQGFLCAGPLDRAALVTLMEEGGCAH